MSTCAMQRIILGAIILGTATSIAAAQPALGGADVPPVPRGLEVPEGNVLFLKGHAAGTQNYICVLTKSGFSWKFLGPQATLFESFEGVPQQISTHFLSMNPTDGAARPTWQDSSDSSRVWGRVVASSTDPGYVEPGAIAWLLLGPAGTAAGPDGGVTLAQTSFIQRLNTSGGVAPSSGCNQAGDIGILALVPYTTDYFFYRSTDGR